MVHIGKSVIHKDLNNSLSNVEKSERTSIYQRDVERLLDSRHAYRCFCSSERLNSLAKQRNKVGFGGDYDRACEGIAVDESDNRASNGEPFVVRLKVENDLIVWTDLVYGVVGGTKQQNANASRNKALFEDPILLKSDGLPTYHLANVVDDHYMLITHVIRAAAGHRARLR